MPVVNVADAKALLSRLIADVERGVEVTIARNGRPCARLVPMDQPKQRPLGFLKLDVPDAFFDPLPDAVLNLFEGGGDPDLWPSNTAARPKARRAKRRVPTRRLK